MEAASWLLLIHQLPARPAYLRVKVWRRVLRIGAVGLRGSVYVLPRNEHTLEDFQWLTREIVAAGGEASVCEANFIDGTSDADLEALFRAARDSDYAALADEVRAVTRGRTKTKRAGDARAAIRGRDQTKRADDVARLRRRLDEIIGIDFFGASRRDAAELLIASLEAPTRRRSTADANAHRGQLWVTRAGIKIDRMASAWLIRRFIDPAATFRWVDPTTYTHAPDHLRFDMSDGEFTHEGNDCSFETLVRRFELVDPALGAIAEIVHDIDLKDDRWKRPETLGLAHVITGIAGASVDDDQRLTRASAVLDDLYAYFAARTTPAVTGGQGRSGGAARRRAATPRRR